MVISAVTLDVLSWRSVGIDWFGASSWRLQRKRSHCLCNSPHLKLIQAAGGWTCLIFCGSVDLPGICNYVQKCLFVKMCGAVSSLSTQQVSVISSLCVCVEVNLCCVSSEAQLITSLPLSGQA